MSGNESPNPDLVYAAVAARRNHFDAMAWQVPIISFTAQAFLFTIALGAETTQFARTIAGSLSVLITVLCVLLLARHRQADIADAEWLEEQEEALPKSLRVHGDPWRRRRDAVLPARGLASGVPLLNAYKTWLLGMILIGLAGILVISVTWIAPDWLTGAAG